MLFAFARKTDALKTCWKRKFLGEKIWRNALALKSKEVLGIIGKTFILALLCSAVLLLQNRVSGFFCLRRSENTPGIELLARSTNTDFNYVITLPASPTFFSGLDAQFLPGSESLVGRFTFGSSVDLITLY